VGLGAEEAVHGGGGVVRSATVSASRRPGADASWFWSCLQNLVASSFPFAAGLLGLSIAIRWWQVEGIHWAERGRSGGEPTRMRPGRKEGGNQIEWHYVNPSAVPRLSLFS